MDGWMDRYIDRYIDRWVEREGGGEREREVANTVQNRAC